jgi:hypothetical protein
LSWQEIDLKDVSTQVELLPAGVYNFELSPGAKYDEKGSIRTSATVNGHGEFTGKRVFFSYPDPTSVSRAGKINSWSAVALKRLEQALGIDINPGEDKVEYLNRVAGTHFQGTVTITPANENYPASVNLNLFNVRPSA